MFALVKSFLATLQTTTRINPVIEARFIAEYERWLLVSIARDGGHTSNDVFESKVR